MLNLTDEQLLALCVLQEAGAECDDGKAAIARVIKNRMARKYESNGTVSGTVLRFDQFSWAYFTFENLHTGTGVNVHSVHKYVRVAVNSAQAAAIAEKKFAVAPAAALSDCKSIAACVANGTYHGALYDALTDDAVLYLNAAILTSIPIWASPDKKVCSIEHHTFYRA